MNELKYVVNVSEIQDYMKCQFRWWCKWVRNRVPLHDSQPLAFGKLLHLIFEDYHTKDIPMKDIIENRRREWLWETEHTTDSMDQVIGNKVIGQLDDITEALCLWKDTYDFDIPVLEVEEPFELELDGFTILRGRPDRVAVRQGSLWHIQNRGLASSTNFATYINLSKRSYHEHAYAEAIAKKYPQYTYGGTFFNLVRKLKYRTGITKSKPEGVTKSYDEMFLQHPMAISLGSLVHGHVMLSIRKHIEGMKFHRSRYLNDHSLIPPPNEQMNGGLFGNVPDEYFRALIGEIGLDDDRYFKNREDMYATESTEVD